MGGVCQGIRQTRPKQRRGGVSSVRSSRGTRVAWFAVCCEEGALFPGSPGRLVWALEVCRACGAAPSIAFPPSPPCCQPAKPVFRRGLSRWVCYVGVLVPLLLVRLSLVERKLPVWACGPLGPSLGVAVQAGRGGLFVRAGRCPGSPGSEPARPVMSGGLPCCPKACVGPSVALPLAGASTFAAWALA